MTDVSDEYTDEMRRIRMNGADDVFGDLIAAHLMEHACPSPRSDTCWAFFYGWLSRWAKYQPTDEAIQILAAMVAELGIIDD